MKMEGGNELMMVNGRLEKNVQQPSPKDIGREFVRQYYTMLSERPKDVFRFYSHESFFMHHNDEPIQGQEKIQEAIEKLQFIDCKARIFTVTGSSTLNNGLVIQVCGELSMRNCGARRFLQTFVLCPQTPKKYYVHNDIFQWLDAAFNETAGNADASAGNVASAQMMHASPQAPAHASNKLNGHVDQVVEEAGEKMRDEGRDDSDGTPPLNEEGVDTGHEADDESVIGETDKTVDEEIEQPPVLDQGPKTWAKMVEAGTTPRNAPPAPRGAAPALPSRGAVVRATSVPIAGGNEDNDQTRRLYLGSIVRNNVPSDGDQSLAEQEIQNIFEKFGPVESVHLPRRSFDPIESNKFAYAFIVMKTVEGAMNAYKACRQDRGNRYLSVKIDSFGFDGEATLSEQKQSSGPPMRGYMGGPPRGGSMMHRGTPRGGGIGVARGGRGFMPRGGGGPPSQSRG